MQIHPEFTLPLQERGGTVKYAHRAHKKRCREAEKLQTLCSLHSFVRGSVAAGKAKDDEYLGPERGWKAESACRAVPRGGLQGVFSD